MLSVKVSSVRALQVNFEPVSCSSLCTKDKNLEMKLQAAKNSVFSFLKKLLKLIHWLWKQLLINF